MKWNLLPEPWNCLLILRLGQAMPRVLGDNGELDLTPVIQELMALRKRTVVSTCGERNTITAITHVVHSQNGALSNIVQQSTNI